VHRQIILHAGLAKLVLKVTIHGMAADKDFANYCCELLASVGPCVAKRMFGGFGISTDGLTIAIIADLGSGEKLWLKGDDSIRSHYEAAACARFVYDTHKDGVPRSMSMNYYSAPEAAMDSADAMRPWAELAMACAVRAKAGKRGATFKTSSSATTKAPLVKGSIVASQLSRSVLERARDAAIKAAVSKSPPSPKATKAAPKADKRKA
jgi:DNA transformation protein and related proteins